MSRHWWGVIAGVAVLAYVPEYSHVGDPMGFFNPSSVGTHFAVYGMIWMSVLNLGTFALAWYAFWRWDRPLFRPSGSWVALLMIPVLMTAWLVRVPRPVACSRAPDLGLRVAAPCARMGTGWTAPGTPNRLCPVQPTAGRLVAHWSGPYVVSVSHCFMTVAEAGPRAEPENVLQIINGRFQRVAP